MTETEPTPFSSSAEDAITRTIRLTSNISNVSNPKSIDDLVRLEEMYEVDWTTNEVLQNGYKQVALQFPDELLHISVPIYQSLRRRLDSEIGLYVLADTSYGSCCVDEVAAQHINADVVVHYGYSCLSLPSHLPVLYVFSKGHIDVHDAAQSLLELDQTDESTTENNNHHYILIPDVAYSHKADELHAALRASALFPDGSQIFYHPVPKRNEPASSSLLESGPAHNSGAGFPSATQISSGNGFTPHSHRRYTLPPSTNLSSCTIFYIGPESLGLTNLLMTHPNNKVISYDPAFQRPTAQLVSPRTNKLLMRRYAAVQRARDADVIGILVGTLGVASYLPLLSHLRKLIRAHHKKSYTLSVGKLSPSKLANFAEIECFVMVACPENSVIDAKEFVRPIVTPFEFSLALSAEPSWPGNYILDFEEVIKHHIQELDVKNDPPEGDNEDQDRPVFSLVTGKYRHAKRYQDASEPLSVGASKDSSAVMLRNTDNTLVRKSESAGAEFLQQRTFKGLEQRLEQDAPSLLGEGRSGVARGYRDDYSQVEKKVDREESMT